MEKIEFVMAVAKKEENIAELCRRYGISRQTGYEVLARHDKEGYEGLRERSHAPRHKPHAMSEAVREKVLELRRERPSWGPKKLKAYLDRREGNKPEQERMRMPAASSMGDLLKQEGLIVKRRKRPGGQVPSSYPLGHADEPNRVWSIDFKGHFKTGDGKRCEPLTVTDNESRYLLRLVAMTGIESERVRAVMVAAFREHGLPEAIRSDNGAPFASNAPGGVTKLSLWWERLGIRHERIEPGKPQQNGRHERIPPVAAARPAGRGRGVGLAGAIAGVRTLPDRVQPREAARSAGNEDTGGRLSDQCAKLQRSESGFRIWRRVPDAQSI